MNVDEEHVLYGGPASPPIDINLTNLGDIFLKQFKEYDDRVLLICAITDEQRRANELRAKSIRLAECLRSLGVRKGDAIAICSENQMEFPIALYAAIYLGAIICPWNPMYTDAELNHVATFCKPKIIFSSNANLTNVWKIAAKHKSVEYVIAFQSNDLKPNVKKPIFLDYEKLLNDPKIKSNPETFKCNKVDDNETVIILISSGTTGLPKGVEITHFNLRSCFEYCFNYVRIIEPMIGSEPSLNVMPWFHAFGLLSTTGAVLGGRTIITLPRFHERKFLSAFAKHNIKTMFAVPPVVVYLAKSPLVQEYDLSSLLIISTGAAPLKKETIEAVHDRLGPIMFVQSYGLSETTLGVIGQRDEFISPGSIGCLYGGTWGKVIDCETGKNLGPNQTGEICVKGIYIMKGYKDNDRETKQMIDEKGWLHTGDVGYYDESGEWYIVDRIKELIKYKGYQVPPAELEGILLTHSKIVDAAVIGLPDEVAGELPLAFVVKRKGEELSEKDVVDYVADKTSYAKRLHGGVRFINEIPKNPTGKILRRILRDQVVKLQKSKL